MDKYEYKLKTEEMLELMENGAYNRAAEIADTIDWRRVRNSTMLMTVSDIYERNGNYQKSYEVLHLALHRTEGSRKVLYRLCMLSLRTGDVAEAIDYYDEFLRVAPKDPAQYILKYKILRAKRAPIEQQIEALCEFKKAEYIEEWAYELAKRYQEAGMTAECLEECDDLILWFSEGKYVYKAMELKMQYKPLTPSQQEKYDHRYEKPASVTDRIPNVEKYQKEKEQVVNKVKEESQSSDGKTRCDFSEITLKKPEPVPVKEEKEKEEPAEEPVKEEKKKVPEKKLEKKESIEDILQRLEKKGIAKTMKLEDAIKVLLNPELEETMQQEEQSEGVVEGPAQESDKDNFVDELPELETAIEEIESVIDVNLVSEITAKRDRKFTRFDPDLEELKAEPLETEVSHHTEELSDETAELPEEVEELSDETAELPEEVEELSDETAELPEEVEELSDETAELPEEVEELSDETAELPEEILELSEEEAEILDESEDFLEESEDFLEESEEILDETVEMPSGITELLDETVEMPSGIEDLLDETAELPEEILELSEEEAETLDESEDFLEKSEEILGEIEELSLEKLLDESENESLDGMEEVEMEKIKKDTTPILPEEIQRLIDEIEGVQPQVVEEKEIPKTEKVEEEPHENMGEVTQQLRIDDIEAFLNEEEDFTDALEGNEQEEELEDSLGEELEEEEELADAFEEEFEDAFEEELDEEEELVDTLEEEFEDEEELTDTFEEELDDEEELADTFEEELDDEEELTDTFEEELEEEEELADAFEEELEDEEELTDMFDDDDQHGYLDEEFEEDYEDIQAGFEAEFRVNPENQNEIDDREVPDEEEFSLLSKSTPLSRKETAKLIATGKTAPLPMNEISDALSMSGTGFLVHGRYDLETQSEIGTRAGLTEEQKKLFSYFVPVRGMSEQLVDVLEQERNCTNRRGTSKTGNLLIIGNKGNGKTVLAVDVVKAIQKQRNVRKGKVAIVTGESLNKKKIGEICDKLYGGALIIEKASKMNEKTVARLNKAMERDTGELLIVLEEQRKPLERLLASNREFRRKFTSRLEVPIFINDELVTFGQTYAQENGYRIDEMGILALYSRIDALQREDHSVTIAEVKEVMDEAIGHSKKTSAKKLVKKVFGKNTDDKDRVILSEKDFNI